MRVRRTAPSPLPLLAQLEGMLAEHAALEWEPPLSGIMAA